MEEFVYFSKLDLLLRVSYDKDLNSIRYETHRTVTPDERKSIEMYLLSKYASETDYFDENYSSLIFLGANESLRTHLPELRHEYDLKRLNSRSLELDTKVNQLLKGSLKEFYFERLGDYLLEFRKQINKDEPHKQVVLERLKYSILELIDAYNRYSETKVTLEKAVPSDLRSYFN